MEDIKTTDDYLRELQNLYFKALESSEFVVAYDVLLLLGREIAQRENL